MSGVPALRGAALCSTSVLLLKMAMRNRSRWWTSKQSAGTLARSAAEEICGQLVGCGGDIVWIDDWKHRYLELGSTPREFMEKVPELFILHFIKGSKGYAVELTDEGWRMGHDHACRSAPSNPWPVAVTDGRTWAWTQDDGGYKSSGDASLEQRAAEDISRLIQKSEGGNIRVKDLDGKIWLRELGFKSPLKFLESRPDVLRLTNLGFGSYTVSLVRAAQWHQEGDDRREGRACWGKVRDEGADVHLQRTSKPRAGGESAPPGAGRGGEKPPPRMSRLERQAICEIKALALESDHVWVRDWRGRYKDLGATPRVFMESHPDIFRVTTEDGSDRRYTVDLVHEAQTASSAGSSEDQALEPSAKEASLMKEIDRKIPEEGHGRVWIPRWKARFGRLAPGLREFLEGKPSIYSLEYQGERRFTVSFVSGRKAPVTLPRASVGSPSAGRSPGGARHNKIWQPKRCS